MLFLPVNIIIKFYQIIEQLEENVWPFVLLKYIHLTSGVKIELPNPFNISCAHLSSFELIDLVNISNIKRKLYIPVGVTFDGIKVKILGR